MLCFLYMRTAETLHLARDIVQTKSSTPTLGQPDAAWFAGVLVDQEDNAVGHGTSPVFVTGMHRSGTSLAAAMIAGAVDLGPTLVEPDENNPQGYFEDRELLSLNRRLLQAATAGSSDGHADWGWSPREQFDVGRLSAFRAEARALVRRRDHGAWGWKDPRLTVLLDFWDPIAPHAKWILVYRFPWDVAESMQQLGTDVFLGHPEYAWPIWRF